MSETRSSITYSELCQIEGIQSELVLDIVEYGIVTPIEPTQDDEWRFESSSVYWIKKASRLHSDLEIDWIAVAMVIELLQQKDKLEKENARVKKLLQRFMQTD